jgi:hypothetical protein
MTCYPKNQILLAAIAAAALWPAPRVGAAVLINEINSDSYNTPTSDYLEYIELYSDTGTTTSLDGMSILLINGNGDAIYKTLDLDGFSTNANGYFVIGSAAVAGAGDTTLLGAGNVLQNGADGVALVAGDATSFPNGTVIAGASFASGALLDAIVYATNNTADGIDTGLLTALGETVQFDEGDPTPASDAVDLSLSRTPNGVDGDNFALAARSVGGPTPVAVPEPASVALLGLAAATLGRRRRSRAGR